MNDEIWEATKPLKATPCQNLDTASGVSRSGHNPPENPLIPNRFADAQNVTSLIYMMVGAGSRCWETLTGAGEFDTAAAIYIGDQAIERLIELGWYTKPVDENDLLDAVEMAVENSMMKHTAYRAQRGTGPFTPECACGVKDNIDGDVLFTHQWSVVVDAVRKVLAEKGIINE